VSTHTAIYARTFQFQLVLTAAERELDRRFPGAPIALWPSSHFPPIYGDLFRRDRVPTFFAIGDAGNGWRVAHFNCFAQLERLAGSLSRDINNRVIVVNVQTVSCCYFLGVHDAGERVRAFNYEDGNWILNDGSPFEFEREVMVANIRESNIVRFCQGLGLMPDSFRGAIASWQIIALATQPPDATSDDPTPPRQIPFWKRLIGW
jgi:hypothetical protein